MFKFDSFTNNLPNSNVPKIRDNTNDSQIPIIHINNLTINITPSQIVDVFKDFVNPKTYEQLPHEKRKYSVDYDKTWNDDSWREDSDDYNYNFNNNDVCVLPNKRLTLDLRPYNKKCGKLTPRQYDEVYGN